jgi:hypothetical protein
MRMINNFPQVGILKVVKMIMPMVDTLSRVGNLKASMLMMVIFLQARIFKALTNIFKALRRRMKNFPQVGILKAVKMIMPMVDTLSQAGN